MSVLYTIVRCRLCKFFIDVFPGVWRWQDCALMRSRALADGKMPAKCVPPASDGDKVLARCVPGGLAVARFHHGAFPGVNPWQVLRSMHPESGLGRENRQFAARFARHASERSWLWQDMRAMYPKSPANRRWRIHRAKILPGRGTFRCTDPSNHARRANLAILRRLTFRRRDTFAEGWDASFLPVRWCRFGHPRLAGKSPAPSPPSIRPPSICLS